jgi:membrane-associated HD superfamily phosphohydrolase
MITDIAIDCLSVFIIILSLLQTNASNRYYCSLVWIPTIPLCLLSDLFIGNYYYIAASLCNYISAYLLFQNKSKLSIALFNALFIAIGLNFMGHIIWWHRYPQAPYGYLFVILYIWIASIIIRKGEIEWNHWAKQLNSSRERYRLLRSRFTYL